MVPAVTVGVSVHQEFQASQGALDPRDQQVSRDHPAIMDLKDPWAHEETKVMKEPAEDRDHQVPVVTKVKMVPLAPKDLKDPHAGSAGSPGNKGDTGARGSQGPPGPKGAPGSFGRDWKQCVFKNLNDGRDSGLIKVTIELVVLDYIN